MRSRRGDAPIVSTDEVLRCPHRQPRRPPHILVLMLDDLGFTDLGYAGSPVIKTPNIDSLAGRAVHLPEFRTPTWCAPSRASFLTGRHGWMLGILPSGRQPVLAAETTLLTEVLKGLGYTTALVGKFHANVRTCRTTHPSGGGFGCGFDHQYGFASGMSDYWRHHRSWSRDGVRLRERGYVTDLLAAEAERVITRHAAEKKANSSLFLWLSLSAPHTPLQAPDEWMRRQPAAWDPLLRVYAAMVGCADAAVGRAVSALRRAKMFATSLVLLVSDNGGPVLPSVCNGGLRGGKGVPFDGGVRVPAFVHWPACLGDAPRAARSAAHMVDVFRTLSAAGGAALPPHGQRRLASRLQRTAPDSASLWPALTAAVASGGAPPPPPKRRLLTLEVSAPVSAVMRGRWKLIVADTRCLALPRALNFSEAVPGFDATAMVLDGLGDRANRSAAEWLRAARGAAAAEVQLFDVGRDPAEQRDLLGDLLAQGGRDDAKRLQTAATLLGHYVAAARAARRALARTQRDGRLDSSKHLLIKWFAKQVEYCWARRHWKKQSKFLRLCVGREAERNVSRTVAGLTSHSRLRRWAAGLAQTDT